MAPKSIVKNDIIPQIDTINDEVWALNRDNPELAISKSEKALKLAKEIKYELGEARASHNIGMCYGWLSQFQEALDLTETSLKTFNKLKSHKDSGRALYSIGTIHYYKGDFKKAKEHYEESLSAHKKAKYKTGITNAYNGLGSVYTELGDYDMAEDYLRKGLKLSTSLDEFKIRPKIMHGLATIYVKQRDFEEAKQYYQKCVELPNLESLKQHHVFSLEGLGDCCLNLGDYKSAKTYLKKALKLSKDIGLRIAEATANQKLGLVSLNEDNLPQAEKQLKNALKIAQSIDGKGIAMSIYKSLSKLYEAKKDSHSFAEHLKKYYELKEELISEEQLNAQNYRLEQAYLNTKVLSDIGKEISSSLSIKEISEKIYHSLNSIMDTSNFAVGIYNEKKKIIEFDDSWENGKKLPYYYFSLDDDSRPGVYCFNKLEAVIIDEWDRDVKKYVKKQLPPEAGEQTESVIYYPLLSKGKALGVITVQSFNKNAYSNHHLDIVKNLAAPIATALENALLYENLEVEVKDRTKELTEKHSQLEKSFENTRILFEIGQDIASSLSIKEVIKKVYRNINDLLDAAVFLIALYDEEKNVLVIEGGMEKGKELPYIEFQLNDENRLAVRCFNKAEEIIISDRERDITKYVSKSLPTKAGGRMESVIYFPLISKGKAMGVFTVQSPKKHAYSDYHVDLLRNLSLFMPIALDNAMLYGRMEDEVLKRTEEIQKSYQNTKMLGEVGIDIISSHSLDKMTDTVYEKVNKLMDAEALGLGLYNEKENRIDFISEIEEGKKNPFHYVALDEDKIASYCFKKQEDIIISDFKKEYKKYVKQIGAPKAGKTTSSIIYIPLTLKKRRIGVLTVQSTRLNAYTNYDLDILKNLGVAISTAIDNALLYESLESQVEERTKEVTEQRDKLEKTYQNTKILSEISQAISSSLSQKEIIKKVYKSVNSIMDAAVFGIGIVDNENENLLFEGLIEKGKVYPTSKLSLNDKDRLAVYSYNNNVEVIISDWSKEIASYVKNAPKIESGEVPESAIYFPLQLKNEKIGVITLQSFEKNAYSDYHLSIIRSIASFVPSTLENVKLYRGMELEVEKRTAEVVSQKEEIEKTYLNTKLLGEIGFEIISTLNINEIGDRVYEKVNELMDASAFAVGLYNEENYSIDYIFDIEKGEKLPFSTSSLDDPNILSTWCFNNQKELIINEFKKDYKKFISIYQGPVAGETTESIVYLPLTLKNKKIGVLTVQSFKPNAYTAYHLDILRNMAISVATAIDNALIYENLEEKVKERTEELVREKEKADFEKEEAKYQRRRAEQSERFKQQFLANMSHEIRTPMNAIMGMTNLVLEKEPKEEHVSYLQTIKHSSESLLVIINDILDLSKIEAGKMELEQTDFNLEEVVNLVHKTLEHRAEEKGLVLSVAYDETIPNVVIGDKVRLQQVLMNIAGNAIKFTEKGGVSISVNLEGGVTQGDMAKIRFEIRDTGIGMTREQQNRVFENFSQATSDTTRKYGGTGLGLSISSKLIELFGSSIKLESELDEGSTFHFAINFKVSKNQEAVSGDLILSDDMIKKLEGVRILIAEDNEYNRIVATETLELKIPNVKVSCAHNGEEAFKTAKAEGDNIDIILMDVQMPVMDGFDATRNIRKAKDKKVNQIPIVALTASVIKTDIQKCYDAGMDGYIPKPFKTSELIQSIYQAVFKIESKEDFEKYIATDKTPVSRKEKITHLSFLQEFTEGDIERMKKYIEMYLDSAISNIPKIRQNLEKNHLDQLKILIHSMKPHFDFMGMPDVRGIAEGVEEIILSKNDLDKLQPKCEELIQCVEQSVKELTSSLKSMK